MSNLRVWYLCCLRCHCTFPTNEVVLQLVTHDLEIKIEISMMSYPSFNSKCLLTPFCDISALVKPCSLVALVWSETPETLLWTVLGRGQGYYLCASLYTSVPHAVQKLVPIRTQHGHEDSAPRPQFLGLPLLWFPGEEGLHQKLNYYTVTINCKMDHSINNWLSW